MAPDFTNVQLFRFKDIDATDLYLSYIEAFPPPVMSLARFREIYFESMPFNRRYSFGYREDGVIPGFVLTRELANKEIYIMLSAVRPEFRKMGLLRAMIDRLVHEAEGMGMREISLDVDVQNPGAQQAFLQLGFQAADTHASLFRFPRNYNGLLQLRPSVPTKFDEVPIDKLSASLLEHLRFYEVYNRQKKVARVILNEERHQIVYFHTMKEQDDFAGEVLDLVASKANCNYIFHSSDEEQWGRLGFKTIIRQVSMQRKLNE